MRHRLLIFPVLVFLLSYLHAPTTQADWINLTGAETAPNIAEIIVILALSARCTLLLLVVFEHYDAELVRALFIR